MSSSDESQDEVNDQKPSHQSTDRTNLSATLNDSKSKVKVSGVNNTNIQTG